MAPNAFLQKPLMWLSALSRYQGTHTAAPSFAYDLCCRRIKPEDRTELDRSEEHTSELQSLMRISSAVFCLKKKTTKTSTKHTSLKTLTQLTTYILLLDN